MTKVTTTAILLAGGIGRRMESSIPKQYLALAGKPVARYSFELFLRSDAISSIVIVCGEEYRGYFTHDTNKPVHFAQPGPERQDSAYHGFCVAQDADLICVHDAAYPLLTEETLRDVIASADAHGAAVAATPVRYTIKEVDADGFVVRTPERSKLWQAQTPQIIRRELLAYAYSVAAERSVQATDDVALMELIGQTVKIVESDPRNIKLTTPGDFKLAEQLLKEQELYCEA